MGKAVDLCVHAVMQNENREYDIRNNECEKNNNIHAGMCVFACSSTHRLALWVTEREWECPVIDSPSVSHRTHHQRETQWSWIELRRLSPDTAVIKQTGEKKWGRQLCLLHLHFHLLPFSHPVSVLSMWVIHVQNGVDDKSNLSGLSHSIFFHATINACNSTTKCMVKSKLCTAKSMTQVPKDIYIFSNYISLNKKRGDIYINVAWED